MIKSNFLLLSIILLQFFVNQAFSSFLTNHQSPSFQIIMINPQVVLNTKVQPEIAEFLYGSGILSSNTLYLNLKSKINDSSLNIDFYLSSVHTKNEIIENTFRDHHQLIFDRNFEFNHTINNNINQSLKPLKINHRIISKEIKKSSIFFTKTYYYSHKISLNYRFLLPIVTYDEFKFCRLFISIITSTGEKILYSPTHFIYKLDLILR